MPKIKLLTKYYDVQSEIVYGAGEALEVSDTEAQEMIEAGTATNDLSHGAKGQAHVVYAQKMLFVPPTPIPLGTTPIAFTSGIDISEDGLKVRLTIADNNAAARPWNDILIDMDNHKAVTDPFSYISVYDNDHIRLYIDDLETGAFRMSAHGRAFTLRKIELLKPITIYDQD